MTVTYGSVCSGIEAATVAWHPMGWQPAWFSEIEPFPCALLAHHYPTVPNLGDMTALPERILSGEVEAPDVLCGGTPCQAFSIAGLRQSLDDARGNLSLVFCEVANAIDSVRAIFNAPSVVIVWENVPGVLNTKDNAFGCFLAGLAGEDTPLVAPRGKWPNAGVIVGPTRAVSWRVLDAQYFGVAQRRRRVFVVASAREGFDPAGVLFEFEGVRRDTAPRREAGEEVTPTIRAGAANGGAGHGARSGDSKDELIVPHEVTHSLRGEGFDASEDGTGGGTPLVPCSAGKWSAELASTLNASFGDKQGLEDQHINGGASWFVPYPCGGIGSYSSGEETSPLLRTGADLGPGCETLVMSHGQANAEISVGFSPTLNCNHEQPIAVYPINMQAATKNGAKTPNMLGIGGPRDPSPTLGASDRHAVAFDLRGREGGAQLEGPHDTANIRAASGGSSRSYVAQAYRTNAAGQINPQGNLSAALNTQTDPCAQILYSGMQVRRLTPRECERLQGFEDDYTLIPVRGKPAANGPRYKALGNSWAVPVVRWLGWRLYFFGGLQ